MTLKFKPYDMVRIKSDRYADEGVALGAVGFVVEEPRNGHFLVEVSRPDGTTIALIAAEEHELENVSPESLGPPPRLSPEDQRKLEQLQQSRTKASWTPRFTHRLYFPTDAAARRAVIPLKRLKYRVDVRLPSEGAEWVVEASHRCSLDKDVIAETVTEMQKLATSAGGRYGGWDAQAADDQAGKGP